MVAKFRKNKRIRPRKNLFFSILLAVLVLGAVGFFLITNLKINQRRAKLTAQIETLKKEIEILEEKNKELRQEVFQAGSEEYLEKVAFDQLGLKPPGAEVVVVTKEEEKKEEVKEKERSWWDWIKGIFSR